MSKLLQIICIPILSLLMLSGCNQPEPQEPDPVRRKSPIAIATTMHEPTDTYIKIVYGQPYKRGRDIFGTLEPYGEIWRTGANEATEITTTKDIIFGGRKLSAGTYSLFSIPRENEDWTIIINSGLGQWGAFEYEEEYDVIRIDAPAVKKDIITEAFTIQFSEIVDDSTNIIIRWDQTEVKVPVLFVRSDSRTNS